MPGWATEWKAFSAGTQPADNVHPMAIEVLKEIGIDHHGRTKTVDEFYGRDFDLVITVCDSAAEKCPLVARQRKDESIWDLLTLPKQLAMKKPLNRCSARYGMRLHKRSRIIAENSYVILKFSINYKTLF